MNDGLNETKEEGLTKPEATNPTPEVKKENKAAVGGDKEGKVLKKVLLSVGAVCAAVLLFFSGWFGHYLSLDGRLRSFLWAVEQTETHYYMGLNRDELYDGLFDVLDGQIDQYSEFYTAAEYAQIERESRGENMGIGVTFFSGESGLAQIYSVVENSPAQKAGLRRGMYVVSYGKTAETLADAADYQDTVDFVREQKQSFVLRCGYSSDGTDAVNYVLTRKNYMASFVVYRDSQTGFAFRGEEKLSLTEEPTLKLNGLDDTTAYIRLDSFTGNAEGELVACLQKMKARGRRHLILDLRDNGGGYMDVLSGIATHLIKSAEGDRPTIATAKYKDGKTFSFTAKKSDYFSFFSSDSKIYLLANDGTASASECLIGAMIDYGTLPMGQVFLQKETAESVGRTYGKGIMQTYYKSINGDVMKLTSATVHWPKSGKCIHDVGVTQTDGAQAIAASRYEQEDTFLTQFIAALFA